MITCPLCDADIDVDEDELDEGDVLNCDECGAGLKVLGTSPVELASDEDDEDGFDDDYEDDEDDEEEDEEEDDEENW